MRPITCNKCKRFIPEVEFTDGLYDHLNKHNIHSAEVMHLEKYFIVCKEL